MLVMLEPFSMTRLYYTTEMGKSGINLIFSPLTAFKMLLKVSGNIDEMR